MLSCVRKIDAFQALQNEGRDSNSLNEKFLQRIGIAPFITSAEMCKIAELDPKSTDLLEQVYRRNDAFKLCFAEEPTVIQYQGNAEFSAERTALESFENTFDIIFTRGICDNLAADEIVRLMDRGISLLREGGILLHALQFYLADNPTQFWLEKYDAFLQQFASGKMEPIGTLLGPTPKFETDMATIADKQMFEWYKANPNMARLRGAAQNVCLIFGGRKLT